MMDEPLWTPEDLAKYTGTTVKTVYDWKLRGVGPKVLKIGRHLRYRRSDVEEWLAAR